MTPTPYEILGVPRDASDAELKIAHRRLVRANHPDAGGDEENFKRIQGAYDLLTDPERRSHYDQHGADKPANPTHGRALGMLSELLASIIQGADRDPAQIDMIAAMREAVTAKMQEFEPPLAKLAKAKERVLKLKGRFTRNEGDGPNMFEDILNTHLERINRSEQHPLEQIAACAAALELLDDYTFRADIQAMLAHSILGQGGHSALNQNFFNQHSFGGQ